ncbi:MAG: class I SAM-dependent methyltransferase [Clostridia bacterium]|nr:class I SAM-dependent methyltransferase [Clostridia bacterium]
MNKNAEYWNKKLPENFSRSTHSIWLDQHTKKLANSKLPILDLGCGNGEDTAWLVGQNFNVVSLDFSLSGVSQTRSINPNTHIFDMSNLEDWQSLKNNSFAAVVANLSLHYFSDSTTRMIMREIRRVLAPDGVLIARVNSTLDTVFGAGSGTEIEPNFFQNPDRGIEKRFFTLDSAKDYFSLIGKPKIQEKTITYVGKQKQIIEVVVKKVNPSAK